MDGDAYRAVSGGVLPGACVLPLEGGSNSPVRKRVEVFVGAGCGGQLHFLSSGALEHHHVCRPAGERERGTGRSGEVQGSGHRSVGRGEIRTGIGRMAAGVDIADLKGDVVTLRVLGDNGDAVEGVVGQVESGGECLPVINGKGGTRIAALLRIADQRYRFGNLENGGECVDA